MLVNADFSVRVLLAAEDCRWVDSPQPGVERVMLDRMGAESGRATSIVRYAPGAFFPGHPHPGGEEVLVLSGTFSEGEEHYPAGWYLRNPVGSFHQPSSAEGATIFVKLGQMRRDDQHRVRIHTRAPSAWRAAGERDICMLFSSETEQVSLQRVAASGVLFPEQVEGAELLVLAGEVVVDGRPYRTGSWMRLPAGVHPELVAGSSGATFYLKTGHFALTGREV